MQAAVNNTNKNVYVTSFDAGIDMFLSIAPLNVIENEINNLKTYIINNEKKYDLNIRYNRIKNIKKDL